MWKLYLLLIGLLFCVACEEKVEDCLDPNATNYNVAADENCCCEYPQLKFSMSYQFDTLGFSTDSTYYSDVSQLSYRIQDFRMYVSNIRLIDLNDEIIYTTDSIDIVINKPNGSSETIESIDDYTLLNPNGFVYDVGTLSWSGTIKKVQFDVGLRTDLAEANLNNVATEHPLALQEPNLFDGAYAQHYFEFELNSLGKQIYKQTGRKATIELLYEAIAEAGNNFSIPIYIDFAKVVGSIDFINSDSTAISNQLSNNLEQAFGIEL